MRYSSRMVLFLLLVGNCYAVTDKDGDGVRDLKDACPQTPKGLVVHANGCSKMPLSQLCLLKVDGDSFPTGCQLVNLLRVYFPKASVELDSSQWPVLEKIAQFLRTYPEVKLLLIGHTDVAGTDKFNMELSFARAQKVRDTLIQDYQIFPARLEIEGKGPAMAEESRITGDYQHADDRKVEFWVRELADNQK